MRGTSADGAWNSATGGATTRKHRRKLLRGTSADGAWNSATGGATTRKHRRKLHFREQACANVRRRGRCGALSARSGGAIAERNEPRPVLDGPPRNAAGKGRLGGTFGAAYAPISNIRRGLRRDFEHSERLAVNAAAKPPQRASTVVVREGPERPRSGSRASHARPRRHPRRDRRRSRRAHPDQPLTAIAAFALNCTGLPWYVNRFGLPTTPQLTKNLTASSMVMSMGCTSRRERTTG
jgi:hypothetical protein